MTSTFDSTGIVMDRYADVLADSISEAQSELGESINTAADGFLGHIIRLVSRQSADANEVIQGINDACSITNATGTFLGNLVALIGLEYQAAAYSTVTLTITATEATTVPLGTQYSTSAGVVFATDTELVFTAAGSDTVEATCTVVGDHDAGIGEVTTIVNAVFGISAVTNAAAATPGRYRETAPELRARHTLAVATSGTQDVSSIYEAVSEVSGVSAVYAFENDTDATIGVVPANHIYITAIGGTTADIAAAIANNKTSAVPTHGGTTVSVYNTTTAQAKDINFDVAANVPIHISMTLSTISGVFPDDGAAQIKALLVADYATLGIADNVIFNNLYKSIYGVTGVSGVSNLKVDIVDPPTGTSDITMSELQRPTLDTDDIDITVT